MIYPVSKVTTTDLYEADELPCRKCGAPVPLTPHMRIPKLRRLLIEGGDGWYSPHSVAEWEAEMETFPGVACRYAHLACPILWTECAHCGDPFAAQRISARYCSGRCRVAAHRARPDMADV